MQEERVKEFDKTFILCLLMWMARLPDLLQLLKL